MSRHPIAPCLWFDNQAEEAAKFYTSVFKHSKLGQISRYGEAGKEDHGRAPGSVLTVEFELNGTPFTALNAGPAFKFTEAISLQVLCDDQQEIDDYWAKLTAGGDPKAQVCGWLKDKFGVSWQIAPAKSVEWLKDSPNEKSERMMLAMMQMKKLDIAALQRAYDGK
jgi:predicted 3-demethylubiquinone-9 3-methyltransferase (glyoxalase superfamily)